MAVGLKGHRLPIISIGRRCRTTTTAASSPFTREQRAEAERQRDKEVQEAKQKLRQYAPSPEGGRPRSPHGTSSRSGGE